MTAKSRTDLATEIAAQITTNSGSLITAATVRAVMGDIIDSAVNATDDGSILVPAGGTDGQVLTKTAGVPTWGAGTPGPAGPSVADNDVTNLKLADMPANTVKANITGGTTDPADVTKANLITWLGLGYAQCQLVKSGANLVLNPYNGNLLNIGGSLRTIPAAGVSLAPTGEVPHATTNRSLTSNVATLTIGAHSIPVGAKVSVYGVGTAAMNGVFIVTAATGTTISYAATNANVASTADTGGTVYTLQYIYAGWSGSAVTLTASTTGYAQDSTTGFLVKSDDATQTLVGLAVPVAGPAWAHSGTQMFVRSVFNEAPWVGKATRVAATNITASGSTSTFVEVLDSGTPTLRVYFVALPGEVVTASSGGYFAPISAAYVIASIAWDGATPDDKGCAVGGTDGAPFGYQSNKAGLAEGVHYATIVGASTVTMIFHGSASAAPCHLQVKATGRISG